MTKIHVTTTVNGDPAEFLADPRETLLDALRDQLGLTGEASDEHAVAPKGKPAPRPVDARDTSKRFVPPKKPRS